MGRGTRMAEGSDSRGRDASERSELLFGVAVGGRGGSLVGIDRVCERALEAEGNEVDDVHVERDQEASWTLVPSAEQDAQRAGYVSTRHTTRAGDETDQSAVAAKDMVLPTYMGSRRTLKGKPSTRWSMRMPK